MAVNDLITFRKGTAAQWSDVNPVLASGEPGYDLTNKVFKIGDGTSVWTQLSGVNQNITAGYDISITNNSGIYTVASTNLVHVDSQQPQGFVNRTDSRISVSGNIFRIEPTGSSYSYYNKGIKVVKTSGDSLTIPNLTQINYIHFDTNNNQISNKTTSFDFSTDIPIAYVAWNSGVGPSGQMTFFAEERHGIVMDTSTHKWIHYTFGAQYVDGLSIGNYVLGGNGSSNSHATISIGNGTLYQEDIEINITDSSSADPFCQELSPIAQIPVYYHEGTTGQWVKNIATDYPVKYGANGPQYNLLSGGTWTIPDVSSGGAKRYFAVWILATNQIDDPIISIMGQRVDSNQGSAENHNSWGDVNLTNLPLSEVKPLYRLIFAADSNSYTNVPKCTLLSILDIRVAVISTVAGVTQNDHGSLFGLGDDDHSQYLHTDNNRTVNAIHNFVNGLTSNGLINSTSGNFTNLTVNNTGVSLNGHTHSSSDITNFNSSVSGLVNGVYAPLTGTLNQFSSTTSSQLISIISDETGSGLLVFNNSPTFTGIPLAPTANSGTNTNQIASTEFVRTEITNLVNSAPSTLDTLNELATALGNDANFSTTITNTLAGKANLSGASFTGSISGPSGDFTVLKQNGTTVSISGHSHIASDITNFDSSVSGLISVKEIISGTGIYISNSGGTYTINHTGGGGGVSINNYSNNRVLTSDGSSTGIDAEGSLTFDGNRLMVNPSGTSSSFSVSQSGVSIGNNALIYSSGQTIISNGKFETDGDAQFSQYVLRNQTSTSSWTSLQNNNSSGVFLKPNKTYSFCANIVGRCLSEPDNAAYKLEGLVVNDINSPSIIGTPVKTTLGETDSSWDVRSLISGVYLLIQVQGGSSQDINWVSSISLTEVGGYLADTYIQSFNTKLVDFIP